MLLDFIFVLTIVFFVFYGYRKGFSQMLISFVILILSFFIVVLIYEKLSDLILRSQYGENLFESINTIINEHISTKYSDFTSNIPFLKNTGEHFASGVEKYTTAFSRKTLEILISIPLFIVSFFVFKIGVFLFRRFVMKASSIPVIRGVDAVLGSICGSFVGIVLVFAIYYVISYIQFLPAFEYLYKQYNSSLIVMLISDFI